MSKKPIQVPFRSDTEELIENAAVGELTHYYGRYNAVPISWRDNFIFDDGLAVVGYYSGRSAMGIELVSVNSGKSYRMTMGAFVSALSVATPTQGSVGGLNRLVLVGHWTFERYNGGYYRVVAVNPHG